MKVAVIEDELRIREGIASLLRRHYPEVEAIAEAKNGEEGLALVREMRPDLVITDIRMEPMDGLEMLRHLSEEKIAFEAVLLSAYSEFTYAKKAISLGVSEYLIKPIDVHEFHQMMQRVKEHMEQRKMEQQKPEQLLSIRQILHGFLQGRLVLDDKINAYLRSFHQIHPNSTFALFGIYMQSATAEQTQQEALLLREALAQYPSAQHEMLMLPQENMLLLVFFPGIDLDWLESVLQLSVLRSLSKRSKTPFVPVYTLCSTLEGLQEGVTALRNILPWALALGTQRLLTPELVQNTQTVKLSYPLDIETHSVEALCEGDIDGLRENVASFFTHCSKNLHSPDAIKKAVLRYVFALLHIAKDLRYESYEAADEAQLLATVQSVTTMDYLEQAVQMLLKKLCVRKEASAGPLVTKAIRLVEEYYHQGITLEEVATQLRLTPEHISAQFNRELGVNFSTFIRQYRLQKAKELLLSSDLKMYEVAGKVGYADAKYFSRIFKESEGVLPGDYRKARRGT